MNFDILDAKSKFEIPLEGRFYLTGEFQGVYERGTETRVCHFRTAPQKTDFQLLQWEASLYAWAFDMAEDWEAYCTLHFPKDPDIFTIQSHRSVVKEIEEDLKEMLVSFESGKYYPKPQKTKCANCLFNNLCIFRKN